MKIHVAFATTLCLVAMARAADDPAAPAAASAPQAAMPAPAVSGGDPARMARIKPELAGFCLYGNVPAGDAKYTALPQTKTSRETYGSVTDELPRFVETAKAAGGDAVIHYNGGQHFGFWPWRLVRPIVSGTPIKWADGQPAPDCEASGGVPFAKVMASNKEPPRK